MRHLPVVLLGLLLASPLPGQEARRTPLLRGPQIVVEPAVFDFGEALQRKTLRKVFTVRNHGTKDLIIDKVIPDCGCTIVGLDDEDKVIEPGGSAELRVELQTRSARGRLTKRVLIRSNDPVRKAYEVKLKATVVPKE